MSTKYQNIKTGGKLMKRMRQILAIIGIVLLFSLYGLSLISAILAKPYAYGLFLASLYSTIAIPILIYGFMIVYKMVHKNDDQISIRELKKKNKDFTKK